MVRLLAIVLAIGVIASGCGSKSAPELKPATGSAAPALDVAGFEPPFEAIPMARAFVRDHHIVKVWQHELERPVETPAVSRETTLTEYDVNGLPVRTSTLSSSNDYAWEAGPTVAYVLAEQRVAERRTSSGTATIVDALEYDATDRLVRTKRSGGDHDQEELRTYDTSGRLVKRTRGDVGQPPFETLAFEYDASGRMAAWSGNKPGFPDDRYTFTYDGTDVQTMAFVESKKPIYDRRYTYDGGFLVRVAQHASVPAMDDESIVYEYEFADGTKRSSEPVALPAKPPRPTDAAIVGALHGVFPHASGERVQWAGPAGKQYLDTITFKLPSIDAALGSAALKDRACSIAKAITKLEREPDGCGCEYLEVAANNQTDVITFHMQLGC